MPSPFLLPLAGREAGVAGKQEGAKGIPPKSHHLSFVEDER